jgi:glyoxylase-like metal-dependent hydrolase (beta-lactamase superfamily II)
MPMAATMDHAADGVWLVTGTDHRWVLVADGDEVTPVDAGFPGDLPQVLSSLERIGRAPGDVRAIVLTHAHPDQHGASAAATAAPAAPIRPACTARTVSGPARSPSAPCAAGSARPSASYC